MAKNSGGASRTGTEIGRQIVLPFHKAAEIAWKSIRIRFWRSVITTSGIVLAIAFLMSIFTDNAFNSALQGVREDHPRYRLVQDVLRREALLQDDIVVRVGILARDDEEAGNVSRWIMRAMQGRESIYTLVMPSAAPALKRMLGVDEEEERPDVIVLTGFPEGAADETVVKELEAFVHRGGALFVLGYDDLWPTGAGLQAKDDFRSLLPAAPEEDVFRVEPGEVGRSGHAIALEVEWETLPRSEFRTAAAGVGSEKIAYTGEGVIAWISGFGRGEVFFMPLAGPLHPDEAGFMWVLQSHLLDSFARWGARAKLRGGAMAIRSVWLVSLSLLVCIVGITNAMLMSVTERFREIGTMKCLGALDKFVVRLFLIESSYQGAAGSVVGIVIGFVLSFGRALWTYRVRDLATGDINWLAIQFFPGMQLLMWALAAVVIGIIISVMAAIYPAYTAAKMEPVEAMRVEA